MSVVLQSPGFKDRLHDALAAAATGAVGGVAAFAFATSSGVDILAAAPGFRSLLATGKFTLIVGLDAITDMGAVAALSTLKQELPNAKIKLFYHSKGGTLFHPKVSFFRRSAGGVCITGSGNLTVGGLRNNWEAYWVATIDEASALEVEASWKQWMDHHSENLLDLDDVRVAAQAKLNAKTKTQIVKVAKETDDELLGPLAESVAESFSLNPFLIAEVPRNRPGQADFGIEAYQGFFGVTLGKPRFVTFYHVRPSGALDAPEVRQAVAVKSSNYRFEVEAMSGLSHPTGGHFILIFERIGNSEYKYVLLKPGEDGHTKVQAFLDANYIVSGNQKRRPVVTRSDLLAAWPESPLLLH